MAFRITPSLGPDVDQVLPAEGGYWFRPATDTGAANPAKPSYQLGSVVIDNEGHLRKFVRAGSSQIATDTQVIIDANGVATAGSGGWWTKAIIPANAYFHATDTDPSP